MGLVYEMKRIQSVGNNFSIFLLHFTIYNLNNSYFLHKNCSKFHKKLVGQYSKGIIGVMKFKKLSSFCDGF